MELPSNTEVTKDEMTIRIDENVLWLEISVNYVMRMNVFDGKKLSRCIRRRRMIEMIGAYEFRHVESNRFHVEYLRCLQCLQITSREVLLL